MQRRPARHETQGQGSATYCSALLAGKASSQAHVPSAGALRSRAAVGTKQLQKRTLLSCDSPALRVLRAVLRPS